MDVRSASRTRHGRTNQKCVTCEMLSSTMAAGNAGKERTGCWFPSSSSCHRWREIKAGKLPRGDCSHQTFI